MTLDLSDDARKYTSIGGVFPVDATSDMLTLKQACAVARVARSFAEREIERGTLIPVRRKQPGQKRRSIELTRLSAVFLALTRRLMDADLELSRRSRKQLFLAISTGEEVGRWRHTDGGDLVLELDDSAPMTLPLRTLVAEILRRSELLARGLSERIQKADQTRGGEPVFRGTRIPLSKVGALRARGVSQDELLAQFPNLLPDDVELAEMFHDLGRQPGRPRRSRPVRRKQLKLRRTL